ncbi:Ribonuclease H domain [Sesbania bispinosa]|nr:Ribonuclease H domain [Sesbania bispinosa]
MQATVTYYCDLFSEENQHRDVTLRTPSMPILSAEEADSLLALSNQGRGLLRLLSGEVFVMLWRTSVGGFGTSFQEGNTHLWNTDWLGCGTLGTLVENVHVDDRDKQVKDSCIQGQWCFDRLATSIPLELKDRILSLCPLVETMNRTLGRGKLLGSQRFTQPRQVMLGFVLPDWLKSYAKSDHCHLFMATLCSYFLLYASGKDFCDHFIARSRPVWTPPPLGVLKVNTDESFLHDSGVAGLGVVIRSDTSEWLLGVSSAKHAQDPLHAELLAIQLGLSSAWEHGFPNLICESDSLEAITLINVDVRPLHNHLSSLVDIITSLLVRNWTVTFHHIFREGNSAADLMARIGLANGISNEVWKVPLARLL